MSYGMFTVTVVILVAIWQIKNAHADAIEAAIQEQEEECNEYYHQIEMAIKHGRRPEDVPKPDVHCEVRPVTLIVKILLVC